MGELMSGGEKTAIAVTRREVLAGTTALALTGITTAAHAQTSQPMAPVTAKGAVFEDADRSGKRGPSSRGIPDVMVSNGRDVVKTGADGSWSLLPEGTPQSLGLRFAGIAPTGSLPDSIDFPLRKQDEPTAFNVVLFTDTQPESLAEVGYIRDDVVAQTAGVAAAFGITHGDVMFDDLSFYARYNNIVGTIGLPWYNCCGNHDMNLEAPDNTHSRDTFQRTFGARYHAFQYGGTTFFILDNVEYLGTDPSKPNGFGKYRGRFGADQLTFVRNVLANVPRDSLVVVSHHIPLKTNQGTDPAIANIDNRDFLAAISTHTHTVSFSGHTHTNEHWYLGADDGYTAGGTHHHHVLAAVSGSWWSGPFDERGIPIALESDGSPNGFHILSVDGNRYTTTLVPARDPSKSQMRIVLDSQLHRADPEVLKDFHTGTLLTGPIARSATGSTRVVVNLFDGGPKSKVSMALGQDNKPMEMKRVIRRDPFVDEVYARNMDTKKPWVNSDPSTHIWQATLPANLPEGAYRVTVTATDEFGRSHADWMVLEVTG